MEKYLYRKFYREDLDFVVNCVKGFFIIKMLCILLLRGSFFGSLCLMVK